MRTADDTRVRAATEALRQLGVAFSTYRLYPGDLTQPTFRSAAERVADAAQVVLAAGALELVIRSGRFHLGEAPLEDDRADRVAEACFQRRVEYLRVQRPPTVAQLGVFFDVVTRDPDAVEEAGGVQAMIAGRGVNAIVASERVPDAAGGEIDEALVADGSGGGPVDPDSEIPPLAPVPGETADRLYERLRAVSNSLSDDLSARSSFFRLATALVDGLTEPERTTFAAMVLDRAGGESFAERYVGHLTDTALGDLVADVAAMRGKDPVDLATTVAAATGRHAALVALVAAAVRHTGNGSAPGVASDAYTDADAALHEGRGLRAAFPDGPADGRELALVTLRDYLLGDPDPSQAEEVLATAAAHVAEDVRRGNAARIRALFAVLDDVEPHVTHDVRPLLAMPRTGAITPAVLEQLAEATLTTGATRGSEVLELFGPAALDALVAALAEQSKQTVRGVLVGFLATLAAGDPARLASHLNDDRWFVVRNIATVLRRIGGASVVSMLEQLVTHAHEAVRKEALHSLAGFAPELAVPSLAGLARRLDDAAVQERCLELLAEIDDARATEALADLASRRSKPRLPWSLRRQARSYARKEPRP